MTFEASASYQVRLEVFEGPLDLLLHLIRKHEIDIFDIPIAFITEKYLEYLALMKTLELDVAAEYLLMAATLAHIKSRMLLPTPPPDDEAAEEEGDPREELIRRLLEYQKYKDVAEQLVARNLLNRDVFLRPPDPGDSEEPPLGPVSLFALLEALKRVLDRIPENRTHEIDADRMSVAERIAQIADRLRLRTQAVFEELFDGQVTRHDVVVTFLALLEMARLRMLRLRQEGADAPIYILLVSDPVEPAEAAEPGAAPGAPEEP